MKKLFSVLFVLVLVAAAHGASITVTKPANNETWVKGQTYAITWTKTGDMPATVKISLRDKNSTMVVQEIVDPAPNSGSYSWAVPASVQDGQYCIRVKVKNVSVMDDSNVFNIAGAAAASITVTKPAAGDKWNRGKTYSITWTKTGTMPNAVKISLMDQNAASVVREIADGVANTGAYLWLVPSDIAFGEYRVRVLVKTTSIMDDSDTFSIAVMSLPPGTIPAEKQKTNFKLPATPVEADWQDYQKLAVFSNWQHLLKTPGYVQPPTSVWAVRPDGYPAGAGLSDYAHVGYDYFLYQSDQGPHWFTRAYRSRVVFQVSEFQGKSAKLISAKMHFKQVSSLIVNDSKASCGTGLFVFLAHWNDFFNPQITGQGSGGLDFGSSDYTIDITDTVKKWLDGSLANNGMLLVSQEIYWGQVAKVCYSAFSVSLTLRFQKD